MTQSEFIKFYCKNSKMTELELNKLGVFAVPCDCEEEGCLGWSILPKDALAIRVHFDLYLNQEIPLEQNVFKYHQ